MIKLKRCPFCGDEVEIVPTGLYHWKYAIHHKSKTECILDANAFALPYEEEDAARMWNTRADRKNESNSEKSNNCEVKNYCDDCLYTDTCDSKEFFYACTSKATISKMEQVDKDINVRCKDEQTDCTEALTLLWIKNMVTDEEFYRIDARLKVMPQTERSE